MKKKITAVLLILVSALVPLLLVEGGMRLSAPAGNLANMVEPDPLLGYHHPKNLTTQYWLEGEFVPIRTNSFGLRQNEEIADPKPPGEKRLLFVGDSFVFGWGVPIESSFFSLLSQKLKEERPEWSSINGGHGGWGTKQMVRFVESRAHQLKPDALALFLSHNDIEDNERINGIYSLEADGSLTIDDTPMRVDTNRSAVVKWLPFYDWLIFHSLALQWARPRAVFLKRKIERSLATFSAPNSPQPTVPSAAELAAPALTRALVLRLAQLARSSGMPLVVFTVGTGTDKNLAFWRENQHWFHEQNIPFFDMTKELTQALQPNPDLYFYRDGHFNRAGNSLFATLAWPHFRQWAKQLDR